MKYKVLLLFAWLLLPASPLHALVIAPFATSNQSPLVQIYGLPSAGDAHTLPAGEKAMLLSLDVANTSSRGRRTQERIELDGESYRLTARMAFGLADGWEWGVELPYLFHRGGVFDNFIDEWHSLTGLPGGNRRFVPRDRLLYRYERDGVQLIQLDRPTQGPGDLRLLAAKEMFRFDGTGEEVGSVALRGSLKLPTGDSGRLLGSGSTDLAIWLTGIRHLRSSLGTFSLYGAGGPLLLTDGDILPEQQRNLVLFGSFGGGWSPWGGFNLKIQIDGNTSFYRNTDFVEMGNSLQLILGGSIPFGRSTTLDLALGEDLRVNASPDVVFHLALRHYF